MKLLPRGRWITAAGIMALGVVLVARGTNSGHPARVSFPIDWSHRHVVFSQPATALQARQLEKEPRYWQQMARHNAAALGRVAVPGAEESQERIFEELRRKPKKSPIQRDWAESLGPGATTGTTTFPQYPAKFTYGLDTTDSCSDYVVFPTNVVGVTGTGGSPTGQPSVIAYQNLYAAAGGGGDCPTGPTIAWAYNTNAITGDPLGVVSGSPLISADGTKVAFVESNAAGGSAVLHLLQYKLGDGTNPGGTAVLTAAPTNQLTSGSAWSACPSGASCMISLTFSTGTAGNSSPFYNFTTDELYLGDDSGVLHKFTGVFNGTPTEVTTGWPITVNAGAALTPAVFDSVTNNLFVGDSSGLLSYVMDTGSTTGTCLTAVAPPCLGSTTFPVAAGLPIIDSPMLDPTTGEVFLFVGDSGSIIGVAEDAYVVQANMDLSTVVRMDVGAAGAPLHSGAFDNAYLMSSPGGTTGFLYVCGKAATTDQPTVRRISFNSDGTLNVVDPSVLQVGSTTGAAGQCSSVTEIFNPNVGIGGTDFIFFSVQSGGVPANCAGAGNGCVMSALVTFAFPSSIDASLAETGGTSGIIIDNVGTLGGDSSIYFSRLGQSTLSNCGASGSTLVGCAVKLTQAALQ